MLAELAAAYHVATEFWDWQGRHVEVPRSTVVAVLAALGVDASSPESLADALARHREEPWRRMLPAGRGDSLRDRPVGRVHVPHGEAVEVFLTLEGSGLRRDVTQQAGLGRPAPGGRSARRGGHLRAARRPAAGLAHPARRDRRAAGDTARWWSRPDTLRLPEPVRDRAGLGVRHAAVLASAPGGPGGSGTSPTWRTWPPGAGGTSAPDFVLVNPLHAAEPVPPIEPSPYLPMLPSLRQPAVPAGRGRARAGLPGRPRPGPR